MTKDNTLLWIVGMIVIGVILFSGGGIKLSVVDSNLETQLKSEYNTKWSDNTNSIESFSYDGSVGFGSGGLATGGRGTFYTNDGGDITIVNGALGIKNPVGEYVFLMYGTGAYEFSSSSGGESGNCDYLNCQRQSNSFYTTCPKSIIKFKSDTLNPSLFHIEVDGRDKGTTTNPTISCQTSSVRGHTFAGIIEYIGHKAQFSCDLSQDEVWIQENFADSFNINDLTFIPSKFCKETRPFILRDIQQGETAIFPDPIPDFNKGKTLIPSALKNGNIIVVNYATFYVQGVNNKCAPNQANIKVGDKWVCSDVIKPLEIVVQCKLDADCPQPLKNTCPSYFTGCINQKCAYDDNALNAVQCKNEVVTIIKQIEEVDKRTVVPISGSNIFTFSQNYQRSSFNIGDKTFSATTPKYLCSLPSDGSDFLYAPSPKSECWQTIITYDGQDYISKDTETIKLNNLISTQYFASGKLTRGEFRKPEDWGNTFIFKIDTENALQLNVEDSSFILKDETHHINLQLVNNLPSGEIVLKIQQKVKATNQNLPEQTLILQANKGLNNYDITINTQNLGINSITIQIFYKIKADNEVLIPSDKSILNYDVVNELPTITKIITIEKEITVPSQPLPQPSTTPVWVYVVGGIGIIASLWWLL